MSKRELFSSERLLKSDNKENLTRPAIIDDGLYVETNNNTERKIKILKILLSNMQFEPDEVIIFIK